MSRANRIVLFGTADMEIAGRLSAELSSTQRHCELSVARDLGELSARLEYLSCEIILLDAEILDDSPITPVVRQLARSAPVVSIIHAELQAELAPQVAGGNVDLVVRDGNFVPLLAGLIERRLRSPERSNDLPGLFWPEMKANYVETLRHDINNPLTGILGNAEMLLAQRAGLPSPVTQRLETIVDLSVRLRETIRRMSKMGESEHQLRAL